MREDLKKTEKTAGAGSRMVKQTIVVKFLRIAVCVMFVFSATLFLRCTDTDEYNTQKGREAAGDFCNCYEYKSRDKCLDELKDNYSKSVYTSNKFISAFNEVETCGIKLELIRE
jgi:hypothetical protein